MVSASTRTKVVENTRVYGLEVLPLNPHSYLTLLHTSLPVATLNTAGEHMTDI
jgi:hypothetical protein